MANEIDKEAVEAAKRVSDYFDSINHDEDDVLECAQIITNAYAPRIAAYIAAFCELRERIEGLPSDIDLYADENDPSPSDTTAHVGGLCVQIINKALDELEPADAKTS